MQANIRPIVMIGGGEKSRTFEQLVFDWIATSIPDAHVRCVALTSYSLDEKAEIRREDAYRAFRPLHVQVERLCELLEADPNLESGFDIIAFGQGGLLARGYVQRCNHPQVHVLITYNTPHGGCSSTALSQACRVKAAVDTCACALNQTLTPHVCGGVSVSCTELEPVCELVCADASGVTPEPSHPGERRRRVRAAGGRIWSRQ